MSAAVRVAVALLLLCAFCVCPPAPPARAADALSALREKAAGLESVSSDFTQETDIPMFSQPLISKGRFAFKRPNSLVWEYLSPLEEGFVLRGDTGFRWSDGRKNRTPFSPGSDPLAAIIARQLVAWITFDLREIEREYRIETLPGPKIRLKMTPLREDMRAVIDSIVITFRHDGPASEVLLTERRGGKTTIVFSNTLVNAPLSDRDFE